MKLQRMTQRHTFNIKRHIWKNGGMVGLDDKRIVGHNIVNIETVTKDGQRLYPNTYYIDGIKARTYPTEPVKKFPSIILRVIPIRDLELFEGDSD